MKCVDYFLQAIANCSIISTH